MSRKVAIVGSRDFRRTDLVCSFVESLAPGTTVVSGGASGVDTIAQTIAVRRGLPVVVVPADWKAHGKKAGPLRNAEIVGQADEVRAFWDGRSRGTRSSIDIALRAKKPLTIVFDDGRKESFNSRLYGAPDFVGGV